MVVHYNNFSRPGYGSPVLAGLDSSSDDGRPSYSLAARTKAPVLRSKLAESYCELAREQGFRQLPELPANYRPTRPLWLTLGDSTGSLLSLGEPPGSRIQPAALPEHMKREAWDIELAEEKARTRWLSVIAGPIRRDGSVYAAPGSHEFSLGLSNLRGL